MSKSPRHQPPEDPLVLSLIRSIIRNDVPEVLKLLGTSPSLARQCLTLGAMRGGAVNFFFEEIKHYLYAGDTPLHAAAAGYRNEIARALIEHGANVAARNR